MAETAQFGVVEIGSKWYVTGDVLMDNAGQILSQSDAFKLSGEVEVDLADVSNADTAALSLMLEWQRRAIAAGCIMKFANLPASLASLANLYDVKDYIPLSAN